MSFQKVRVWNNVNKDLFYNEIVPLHQPAILKGLVSHWPIVKAGLESPESLFEYLKAREVGGKIKILESPQSNPRLSYNDDLSGFNFEWKETSFETFCSKLQEYRELDSPPTLYLQSAYISDYFTGVEQENVMEIFEPSVRPRIWIGNATTVPSHYDDSENIACVACGHRRFTLFPPEQIANMYPGPLEFTPAGACVSMASVNKPDFEQFPRFEEALKHAQIAELEPGDAVYVPTLWWHNVEALDKVNVLINYWKGGSIAGRRSTIPMDALLHSLITIKELPPQQRKAWKAWFDYYVFQIHGDPGAHIPERRRGVLGTLNQSIVLQIKNFLLNQLKAKP